MTTLPPQQAPAPTLAEDLCDAAYILTQRGVYEYRDGCYELGVRIGEHAKALLRPTPVAGETEDGAAIMLVHQLRHRVGTRHECKCEECQAISRVCALAREAIAMKAAKRKPARRSGNDTSGTCLKTFTPSDRPVDFGATRGAGAEP